ncbi:hypothetical protein CEXT_233491, partial [Caerostris extrusa]
MQDTRRVQPTRITDDFEEGLLNAVDRNLSTSLLALATAPTVSASCSAFYT